MMERGYTLSELDALRRIVRNKVVYGSYLEPGEHSWQSAYFRSATEIIAAVEEVVRTHMIAGHVAADLLASEDGGKS